MDQWTNGPMDQWTNGPMEPPSVSNRHLLPVLGKLGPERFSAANWAAANGAPANWAPANWAPADWAPWRQIGPRQMGPWHIGPLGGKLGPRNFVDGKLGPGKLGPLIIWMQHIVFVQYKYIFIGESMSVGFGYILPNIGEYMLVELIYWYWIYSANNWEIYIT